MALVLALGLSILIASGMSAAAQGSRKGSTRKEHLAVRSRRRRPLRAQPLLDDAQTRLDR